MAGDIRTGVVITAEAQGFDEALQKILKVSESALKGMKDQAKSYDEAQSKIVGLDGQIVKLAKTQATLFTAMAGIKDKSSVAYKALSESLKQTQGQSEDLEGAVKNLEKAYSAEARAARELNRAEEQLAKTEEKRKQSTSQAQEREDQKRHQAEQQAKWAFTQGFAQTAAPGVAPLFLQRGPGFLRQAAGQATGAVARGALQRTAAFGGAVAQAPFQGAQGLAQMASALPGGGILGGMMGTAVGYAGRAMEWRRQQLEAMPYVGGGLEMAVARGAAGARYQSEVARSRSQNASIYSDAEFQKMIPGMRQRFNAKNPEAAERAFRASPDGGGYATRIPRGYEKYAWAQKARQFIDEKEFTQFSSQQQSNWQGMRAADNISSEKQASIARQRTIAGARRRMNDPVYAAQREGVQFGMAKDQSLQAMTEILRSGGGSGREMMNQGMLKTGFAAKTLFGIGGDTSGAFLQAGRRGGISGGPGQADQMMTRAINDGLKLGLEGSEMVDYMQSMAEGIKQWETTGIPIAPDAIKEMATTFSQAGISGTRAAKIASGAASYMQGIGARGPQGGLDMMLLNKMGGYTGTGGAAEYEKAVIQMEEMGGKLKKGGVGGIGADKGMSDVMRSIMEMGGGGATGRFFLRSVLGKQMGIQMGQKEIGLLEKQLTGGKLTPEEQKYADSEAARRAEGEGRAKIVTTKGLIGAAKGAVPGELKAQAAIQNQQIAAGENMINVVNSMDKAAADLVKSFSNLAGDAGPLVKLTKQFQVFGAAMEKVTNNKDVSFGDVWDVLKKAAGLN